MSYFCRQCRHVLGSASQQPVLESKEAAIWHLIEFHPYRLEKLLSELVLPIEIEMCLEKRKDI